MTEVLEKEPYHVRQARLSWNDGRDARLKDMLQRGASLREIARVFGEGFSATRVAKRAKDLGLPPSTRRGGAIVQVMRSGPPVRKELSGPIGLPDKTVEAVRTVHGCRWPIGETDKPGFRFCCAPKSPDHSYCEHHRAMARDTRRVAA